MAGTIREWASANDPAYLFMVLPEEIPNSTKAIAQYQAYGDALVRAVDDVIVAGQFPALASASPSSYVLDQRDRVAGSATYTTLPTLTIGGTAALPWSGSQVYDISGLPEGDREYSCRTRDTSDEAVSPWVTRAYTVDNVQVEPVPAGAWFAINGVVYSVLGDGVEVLEPEYASGEVVRSFAGNLRSTVSGEIAAWRIPLYDLSATDHATLRTALARQRRITAGGLLFGSARSGGFAATVELSESRYEWQTGGGFLRVPSLIIRAVDRG